MERQPSHPDPLEGVKAEDWKNLLSLLELSRHAAELPTQWMVG